MIIQYQALKIKSYNFDLAKLKKNFNHLYLLRDQVPPV